MFHAVIQKITPAQFLWHGA